MQYLRGGALQSAFAEPATGIAVHRMVGSVTRNISGNDDRQCADLADTWRPKIADAFEVNVTLVQVIVSARLRA